MFELNKEQRWAVQHKDGPMLVLAGPGSGKTQVIIKRVINLIEHYNIKPEEILVLTFSKAAANQMQHRFEVLSYFHNFTFLLYFILFFYLFSL